MARHGAQRKSRSPFVIDVSRLGRRPGSMVELTETVAAPARIGIDMVGIAQGAPVELDLRLESVSEGVLVTGTVSAPTAGDCARCLTPITGNVEIDLTELFAYPDSATEASTEADEIGHVVDDTIDLEQLVIDAIGLVLPFAPVCGEDCPGPVPAVRSSAGRRRARSPARPDRPALGEAGRDAAHRTRRRGVTGDLRRP